jgi:large subunit ribosomal protein L37e
MTKGTPSAGKHSGAATHSICRRCGKHSYFKRKGYCASCGFGRTARLRNYGWNVKIRAAYGLKARNGRKNMAQKLGQKH